MNKKCARCLKTVYPLEELKCFDKVWHKTCFRCTVCGMALTLKNYREFDRMPYCNAHMPKVQATAIASTPEMKRLTNNTRIQSNIKYHEEYERSKRQNQQPQAEGNTTPPEPTAPVRSKASSKMSSNVAYRVCRFEHKNIVEQRKRELDEGGVQNSSHRSGFGLNEAGSSAATKRPSLVNLFQAKPRPAKPSPTADSSQSSFGSFATDASTTSPKPQDSLAAEDACYVESVATLSSSQLLCTENVRLQRLDAGNAPEHVKEIFLRGDLGRGNSSRTMTADTVIPPTDSIASGIRQLNRNDQLIDGSDITLTNETQSPPVPIPKTASKWEQDEEDIEAAIETHDTQSEITEKVQNLMVDDDEKPDHHEKEEPSTSSRLETVERKSSTLAFNVYRAIKRFDAHESDEVSFEENDIIYEVVAEESGWITGRVERTGKIGLFPANLGEKIERKSQLQLALKAQLAKIKADQANPK